MKTQRSMFGVQNEAPHIWGLLHGTPATEHFKRLGFSHIHRCGDMNSGHPGEFFMISKCGSEWVYAHWSESSFCIFPESVYTAADGNIAWLMSRHDRAISYLEYAKVAVEDADRRLTEIASEIDGWLIHQARSL